MKEIYLVRHGIAEDPSDEFKTDADRPLTGEGRRKMAQISKGMQLLGLDECGLILSSPYVRARETAEIIHQGFEEKVPILFTSALVPNGSIEALIRELNLKHRKIDQMILVGHEPLLSSLISLLISGRETASVQMKKGSVCKLSYTQLIYGACATMNWLLPPRVLSRLG